MVPNVPKHQPDIIYDIGANIKHHKRCRMEHPMVVYYIWLVPNIGINKHHKYPY